MKVVWSGRVVLVNPPHSIGNGYMLAPPLGLAAVASELRDAPNLELELVDQALDLARGQLQPGPELLDKAATDLSQLSASIYAFSVQCFNLPIALCVAKRLRSLRPASKIVFGGHQATLLGQAIPDCFPWVDEVLQRPPVASTVTRTPGWLDPEYSVTPPISEYAKISLQPTGLVQTAEGCPFSCTFCTIPVVYGLKVSRKPIEYVIRQVREIGKYTNGEIHFVDDIFTLDKNYVRALMARLKKLSKPITWTCMTRVDFVDPELLAEMGRAGCHSILYGVDSGSARSRSLIQKRGLGYPPLTDLLAWNLDAGIRPTMYFLVNIPDETVESVDETLREATRLSIIDPGSCHLQMPRFLPGTKMGDMVAESLVPAPELPYAKILHQTVGHSEEIWNLIDKHRNLFSTYCTGPGPLNTRSALAMTWVGPRLLRELPLVFSVLVERGCWRQVFDSLAECVNHCSWDRLDWNSVIGLIKNVIREEAPELEEVLIYEIWRASATNGELVSDNYITSRVDHEAARSAAKSGASIQRAVYAHRQIRLKI